MYQYKAKIVRWVDGDTVIVDIDLGFFCVRQERLRLARISAHELNSETLYGRRRAYSARFHADRMCPVWFGDNCRDEQIQTRPLRSLHRRDHFPRQKYFR